MTVRLNPVLMVSDQALSKIYLLIARSGIPLSVSTTMEFTGYSYRYVTRAINELYVNGCLDREYVARRPVYFKSGHSCAYCRDY